MSKKESLILKVAKRAFRLVATSRLPAFSSKFANRIYSQHQHFALLVLKKHLQNTTYRDVVDVVSEMPRVLQALELEEVPHYSTLQKFFERLKGILLDLLARVERASEMLAVDSTGFSSEHSSLYYQQRIRREVQVHSWNKLSIVIDPRSQLICNILKGVGPSNDCPELPKLLEPFQELQIVLGDKGYDSEANLRFIMERGGVPIIPVRQGKITPTKTKLRKRMLKLFPSLEKVYHQRSKVETVFSVMKRRFGASLRSKRLALRMKELALNAITYNCYRKAITILKGFLQSR